MTLLMHMSALNLQNYKTMLHINFKIISYRYCCLHCNSSTQKSIAKFHVQQNNATLFEANEIT